MQQAFIRDQRFYLLVTKPRWINFIHKLCFLCVMNLTGPIFRRSHRRPGFERPDRGRHAPQPQGDQPAAPPLHPTRNPGPPGSQVSSPNAIPEVVPMQYLK